MLVTACDLRIYFGHQSVGANIVTGIGELVAARSAPPLRVVHLPAELPTDGGFFAHEPIGRNGDPAGKTDAFVDRLTGRIGDGLDVALHKYCYVDIGADTDVTRLFEHYRRRMSRLRETRPDVVLVHVTAPLRRVPSGPVTRLRAWVGPPPSQAAANAQRERFNDLLREACAGREPLFVLAAAEATMPDGRTWRPRLGRLAVRSLATRYTDDGGHLNPRGRAHVAGRLLGFLADLSRRSESSRRAC